VSSLETSKSCDITQLLNKEKEGNSAGGIYLPTVGLVRLYNVAVDSDAAVCE